MQVALDLSGRPFLVYDVDPVSEWIGTFDPQLAEEFWRAFAFGAGHHAAPALAVGPQRPPRDRGVVQGRGPCLRDAVRIEGTASRPPRARCTRAATSIPPSTCAAATRAPPPGDFDDETVYDDDPVGVARRVRGRRARSGSTSSTSTRPAPATAHAPRADRRSASAGRVQVEVGGGVRSVEAAAELLDAGVDRVVVGTAAVEHPELVDELCHEYPGRIAVGLDARGNEVAIRGWVEGAGTDLVTLAERFEGVGARRAHRHRDRSRRHPRRPGLRPARRGARGDGHPGDRERWCRHARRPARAGALRSGGPRPRRVIVGRALYEGRFNVAEALASLAEAVVD